MFVPAVQHNSVGPDWAGGDAGTVDPDQPVLHRRARATPVSRSTRRSPLGKNLILTPGVYQLTEPIEVSRPDTIVLGLGFATLIPQNGNAAMETAERAGDQALRADLRRRAGQLAGRCVEVGGRHARRDARPRTTRRSLQDVFFRIGGAEPGKATTSLVVNADNAILDDIWAWRADHGTGVGWTSNTADTGVIVNGDDVTAYGLFVEHFQKFEVIWNGQNGEDVFFQNEMPYDPPSQAAWMSSPTTDGYAAFLVSPNGDELPGLRHGQLLVLQPGRADLRDAGVPGADEAGRAVPRPADRVPRRDPRQRRDQCR